VSFSEFSILKDQGLLLPHTIIIHGIPLGANDLADVAAAEAS